MTLVAEIQYCFKNSDVVYKWQFSVSCYTYRKVTLLMVGLDNAGKTSTVADLNGGTCFMCNNRDRKFI